MSISLSESECQKLSFLCEKEGIRTLSSFFKKREITLSSGLLIPIIDSQEQASLQEIEEWIGGAGVNARGITKNLFPYVEAFCSDRNTTPEGTRLTDELKQAFGTKVQDALKAKKNGEAYEILPTLYTGLLAIHKERINEANSSHPGRKSESPLLKWLELALLNDGELSKKQFGEACGFTYVTANTRIKKWQEEELLTHSRKKQAIEISENGKVFISNQRDKLTSILMDLTNTDKGLPS